ncbi:hypothetical protein Dole_1471 [Desulfosudis oleivorans Hxd3]|uniref:Uncharacterized protein n=1 Tax=Desulfosudis oleivorans (strain DSM 6200 / JCM 39069 / Hxd3) TaxID=96561 RepID=A8ZZC2_DESOH|nr:hypothetical protein Dole_1471 [Desulfosudis oleivorans Hxd3]
MYFSWRQEKYQKKRAPQLGLRLPSRKGFFRGGQELARFAVLKQPARLLPEKAFALGCAATGGIIYRPLSEQCFVSVLFIDFPKLSGIVVPFQSVSLSVSVSLSLSKLTIFHDRIVTRLF